MILIYLSSKTIWNICSGLQYNLIWHVTCWQVYSKFHFCVLCAVTLSVHCIDKRLSIAVNVFLMSVYVMLGDKDTYLCTEGELC